ncbi:hypothetical protein [Ahrensia sp. R2A130]|uniref:hypothetical protein n=1 Tax=Ahrensia sp. R2A130 TaxID=744979 RepID=UPI0001E0942D|nr:hypothetical protein [Ahrensia sp. R2A130]EFL90590.1 hypothetical protein R2A130_0672 [Ahrensia sp. R2A130]
MSIISKTGYAIAILGLFTLSATALANDTPSCTLDDGKLSCEKPVIETLGSSKTTFLLTKLDREGVMREKGSTAERFRLSLERQRKKAEREMRRAERKANRSADHVAAAAELAAMRDGLMRNYRLGMRTYYGNIWFKRGDSKN